MWPPGPGLPQHAVADSKKKKAELFPATSSCVLWISNDLRRVAALGNYMLSDATFVHSVRVTFWMYWMGHKNKTVTACGSVWPLWVHVNCTLTILYLESWQCLLACRWFNLCFNKQQIFGRFPRKQTWPAVECCSSSAVDLRFCWSVPRSGAVSGWSLLLFCQKATKETEQKTARLLHRSQVAYICGPSSVRGTRPSTYATQIVIM